MIAKYNNISLIAGAPGIILQSAGTIMTDGMKNENTIGLLFLIIGSALLLVGFAFYAKAKGRSPAWCLMAFLSFIGLIVLASLTDKTKNINQANLKNRNIGKKAV
jgi:xanthosine utilization system XapX-like protein